MTVQGWTFLIVGATFALYIVVALMSQVEGSTSPFVLPAHAHCTMLHAKLGLAHQTFIRQRGRKRAGRY